jgi:MYXO-CTERM domain-containing protein
MAGRRTSALVVTSDDPASPTKQPLFITGTNPKGMFNPASIDFGNTRVTKPNKMTFNIVNGGDGPMNVLSMDLLGNDPAQFTFQPPAPFVVAPMTMTPVQVTFTPNKVKMFSASIKVTTDDPNFAMGTLPLTGNGTSPILRVMPVSLDFGTVIVGQCAPAKSFMVCNDGNDTMKVTAFQIGGPGQQAFNGNPKLPMPTFNIAPGACNTYNIEYCPTDNTGDSATVIINTDDPNTGDAQVMLSGFGAMAQLATMPMDGETQDFGIVVEGLPKSNALVITNTGQAPLVINSIKAITMDANMMPIPSPVFSVDFTGPFPLTIPPQGKGNPKVAMKIIFAPIDEKPATATLVITPDPKTNLMPVNIPLMGTGKKAAIQCITAGALNDIDFGQVMVGTTSPVTSKTVVTIFNGDSAAQIVNVTSDKPEFMAEKAMISVPAMPVKAQFNVVFTPDLVQKFNGTIKVSLPGSTAALCSIPVTGEGVTGGTDMGPPVVTSRGGCSVGARSPAGAAGVLLVLLVGLVGRRRRRR